jgi:hypothetical protein
MVEIKHNAKLTGNDDFILAHQLEHVYYLKYPYQKMAAWWVVYKVNPRERLYAPTDVAYHFDDGQVDEIYQEEELSTTFVIKPGPALDSLVGDGADVTVLLKRKWQPVKKKCIVWPTLEWRRQLHIDPDEF